MHHIFALAFCYLLELIINAYKIPGEDLHVWAALPFSCFISIQSRYRYSLSGLSAISHSSSSLLLPQKLCGTTDIEAISLRPESSPVFTLCRYLEFKPCLWVVKGELFQQKETHEVLLRRSVLINNN